LKKWKKPGTSGKIALMKVTVPEELKKDMPQTQWGKILSATPIVMTVIATLLAGLASSEMTRAQYDRAFAAQLQSKAGDQWGYFQAKKMRAAMQRNTLELLEATTDVHPIDNPALEKIPAVAGSVTDPGVQTALAAVQSDKPEAEVDAAVKAADDKTLAATLQSTRDQARNFDAALVPANAVFAQLEKSLPPGDKSAARDLTAAGMLELQVHKANISAERHHKRSQKFFFGMLAAQAAIIVSTFAMAARRRNLLWTLAAVAGLAAIVFAIYVYLRV
jgi:hypothetical protein